MASVVRMRQLVHDNWRLLDPAGDAAPADIPAAGDVIVPLLVWRANRERLLAHPGRLGVWLDSHEGPEAIADDLAGFALVAVNFPKFTDGRGYSTGRLLRDRYGYRGELRAIGDVQRDQLLYLARCGFDSFTLKEGRDAESALAAFDDFSEAYQGAADRPLPLYRRRDIGSPDGMEKS